MASKGTIVITGANGGLGSAIVSQVVSQPALAAYHGIYTVRDADSDSAWALDAILEEEGHPDHPHRCDVLSLDLTKIDAVRRAAEVLNARVAARDLPPIRTLILNAGLHPFATQRWTGEEEDGEEGLEETFSANYLGHFLFTLLVLQSMDRDEGRIVVIGSQAHDPCDPRNEPTEAFIDEKYHAMLADHSEASFEAIAKGHWSTIEEDPSWRSGFRRYGASKLFLIMMMHELQRRIERDPALKNICVVGVDPGTMPTGLQRNASWLIRVLLFQILYPLVLLLFSYDWLRSTSKSASHVLQAAFDSNPMFGQSPKGLYLDGGKPLETSAESRDVRKRDMVWRESVRYAGLKQGETILVDWR